MKIYSLTFFFSRRGIPVGTAGGPGTCQTIGFPKATNSKNELMNQNVSQTFDFQVCLF